MRFNTILSFLATAGLAASTPLSPILQAANIVNIANVIPNQWIVVMKDISDSSFQSFLASRDASIISSTKAIHNIGTFKAFSGTFSQTLVNLLLSKAEVAYIEADVKVSINALSTQSTARPWGLGRISHRKKGSTDFVYESSAGVGTYSYVIDTGVLTTHVEFEGRATFGVNLAGDGLNTDGNGHGTHVAGTIGSRAYGVAKKTNIIDVKVLDSKGAGALSNVILGIEWAVKDMESNSRKGKALANLSIGTAYSQATNDAVKAAVGRGLFIAVAAGNNGGDAALYSPGSEATACTVGASDANDVKAAYSNYGTVVDIFAPGSQIMSTWIRSNTDSYTQSGTSMSTPHIVGLAACLISLEGAKAPGPLCERMKTLSTKDVLTGGSGASVNYLAYNGNGA